MRKIPTLFLRDPETNMKRLTRQRHPDCLWVFKGEGFATRKYDGTCCMMRGGILYKRREVKKGKSEPEGFELVEEDPNTGKRVGWVKVGCGPEDKWFLEAYDPTLSDGTYELIGPMVQGNPEGVSKHLLMRHGTTGMAGVPCRYDELREWLKGADFEGIVWHHPDGRMAKIKRKDFW